MERDDEIVRRRQEIRDAFMSLETQSHFEVLGVSESATEQEVKQAYFQKAKKFHPDQYQDPGFADITYRIEALFIRIGTAYDVLRNPQSRQSYEAEFRRRRAAEYPAPRAAAVSDPQFAAEINENQIIDSAENARMAEEAIHRADRLIHDSKVWDAIQLLEVVIPRIYERKQRDRARVLLATAYIKNPKWLRRGEELLQSVIQEDPENAEAHFALGMLYKDAGLSGRAELMFRQAFKQKGYARRTAAQLAALTTSTLSLLGALDSQLTTHERVQALAAIERAQKACSDGELPRALGTPRGAGEGHAPTRTMGTGGRHPADDGHRAPARGPGEQSHSWRAPPGTDGARAGRQAAIRSPGCRVRKRRGGAQGSPSLAGAAAAQLAGAGNPKHPELEPDSGISQGNGQTPRNSRTRGLSLGEPGNNFAGYLTRN